MQSYSSIRSSAKLHFFENRLMEIPAEAGKLPERGRHNSTPCRRYANFPMISKPLLT